MPATGPVEVRPDAEETYRAKVAAEVLRVLDANRGTPLLMEEIIERVDRRQSATRKAGCATSRDRGWLIVTTMTEPQGAAPREVERFQLDPGGPAGDHHA